MKQSGIALLLCCVFCLTLMGCGTASVSEPDAPGSLVSTPVEGTSSAPAEPSVSAPAEGPSSASGEPAAGAESSGAGPEEVETADPGADQPKCEYRSAPGASVSQAVQGKTRITYNGNESSVRYITSAADLPNYSGLEPYDDAYFADHALLLVTESTASGSVKVGIEAVDVSGAVGTVTLSHSGPDHGTDTTDDMATWLLWVEVDAGLECRWTVANPALESDRVSF